jgi:hypothetical protein
MKRKPVTWALAVVTMAVSVRRATQLQRAATSSSRPLLLFLYIFQALIAFVTEQVDGACHAKRSFTTAPDVRKLLYHRLIFRGLHIAALGNPSSSAIEVLARLTTKICVDCEGRVYCFLEFSCPLESLALLCRGASYSIPFALRQCTKAKLNLNWNEGKLSVKLTRPEYIDGADGQYCPKTACRLIHILLLERLAVYGVGTASLDQLPLRYGYRIYSRDWRESLSVSLSRRYIWQLTSDSNWVLDRIPRPVTRREGLHGAAGCCWHITLSHNPIVGAFGVRACRLGLLSGH